MYGPPESPAEGYDIPHSHGISCLKYTSTCASKYLGIESTALKLVRGTKSYGSFGAGAQSQEGQGYRKAGRLA